MEGGQWGRGKEKVKKRRWRREGEEEKVKKRRWRREGEEGKVKKRRWRREGEEGKVKNGRWRREGEEEKVKKRRWRREGEEEKQELTAPGPFCGSRWGQQCTGLDWGTCAGLYLGLPLLVPESSSLVVQAVSYFTLHPWVSSLLRVLFLTTPNGTENAQNIHCSIYPCNSTESTSVHFLLRQSNQTKRLEKRGMPKGSLALKKLHFK